ncbi:SDR family oxidoreductase [Micromonospora sp. WMMD975]|uniref:SDR family oxidoreductase n=1 Tax=Micromonospora sp. WMMD975 TaxID=3016087 RepID=UPI00249A45A2|nr:SDR family oxidoreductase [Micromonospora sp. WMMD975]WFE36452.1 SDR family NAD(P)-dependent oxidoreductase [Micromonospora sp. WMMD975]
MSEQDLVRDRCVVVTGGGNGIGRAIARKMAAQGARVVVGDLDTDAAARVAAEVGGVAVGGDASTDEGVARLLSAAGHVDVFFANAGSGVGKGIETPDADWHTALEVNVMAHVRAARALIPGWLESGGGRFVVTASAAGLLTMLGSAPYSVSKHAAVAFAEWLAVTYGHRGVTVQAICPQGVRTKMLDDSGEFRDLLSHDAALEPEQVAEVVWEALHDDRFLILPHPEVQRYYETRAGRTDAWLAGMRKLQKRFDDAETVVRND